MVDVESFEEMVGTREAAAVATESGGVVATESGGAVTTSDETVATAGDETAAAGVIMFTDEGELEFDENKMSALERQRLVAEFFQIPDLSWTSKASMRVRWQEISVAETTVDRKQSPTRRMMMTRCDGSSE